MKPVLLATDGSPTAESATETAIELAQTLGTDLVIVTVWNIPYTTAGLAPAPVNGDVAVESENRAREVAFAAAARAEEAGVETRALVVRGTPIEQICASAELYEPRFLVVGSHGWGAFKRALFGSVSTGVLHHAACPVLVVPAERAEAKQGTNGARTHVSA